MCRTHCCHDIYISDYLIEWSFSQIKKNLHWTLEKNYKQTWSKQEIAHISSVNECHEIDTSSRARKTVADQEKDEQRFYTKTIKKRWTTLYEDRKAWSRITTWVRALKWGTTYGSASKRGKCVSTQMQPQKISPINCTGHPTEIKGCVLVPRTQSYSHQWNTRSFHFMDPNFPS